MLHNQYIDDLSFKIINIMAKSKDVKKTVKKEATKTPKEKKEAKKLKKSNK